MKLKNIPADIRAKSIKDAQNEIKYILEQLENNEINLEKSLEKYNRMIQLNHHIHDEFKKLAQKINKSNVDKT